MEMVCSQCGNISIDGNSDSCERCGSPFQDSASKQEGIRNQTPALSLENDTVSIQKTSLFYYIIPLFSGIAITVLFQKYIETHFSPGSLTHQLFVATGGMFQKAVPKVILILFFWSIADILLKALNIQRLKNHIRQDIILNIPNLVKFENIDFILEQLKGLNKRIKKGNVYKRIYSLMDHMKSTNDPQRVHEFFRHQTDIDSDVANSRYTLVRTFIWAMPILGFIGTVIGIGLAVGEFSSFLTEDIDNIDLVKVELSKVASGLSYAFYTTLLGLIASLIAMVATTFVHKNEEEFYTGFEELGLNIIGNFKVAPPPVSPENPRTGLVDSMEVFLAVIDKKSVYIAEHFDKFATQFEESSKKIAQTYSELPAKLEKHKSEFRDEMTALTDNLTMSIERVTTTFKDAAENMAKRFSSLTEKINGNEDAIRNAMKQLEGLNQQLELTFKNSAGQFVESSKLLTRKVEAILPTQDITLKAVDSLNSMNRLLKELQDNQKNMIPLLQQLSGPLEFKLIPSQKDNIECRVIDKP